MTADPLSSLHEVAVCPLCGGARTDARAVPDANLYSEQLAALLDCNEAALLAAVANVRCVDCGLWYKARWFAPSTLRALFGTRVPDHPKGWDAVSDRFSVDGFARAIDELARSLDGGDAHAQARCRRSLLSIVDSLQGIDGPRAGAAGPAGIAAGPGAAADAGAAGDTLRASLRAAVAAGDIAMLAALQAPLADRFDDPAPFKRFSGFSSPLLWDWLVSHAGPVRRYGEVGCPLWGQLLRPMDPGVVRMYFGRDEANYWSAGCCRGGRHCSALLGDADRKDVAGSRVDLAAWPPARGQALDVLAAFQYLDHLEAPAAVVDEAFAAARALLLVFDDGAAPSAIQHATGWGDRPVAWLARRHGKRVVDDFAAIAGSGNRAWLLCDG